MHPSGQAYVLLANRKPPLIEATDNVSSTPVLCWGHRALPTQKGITLYTVSANRLDPLAQAGHNAIFNSARRMRYQFYYVVPPFMVAYVLLKWMEERYVALERYLGEPPSAQLPSYLARK